MTIAKTHLPQKNNKKIVDIVHYKHLKTIILKLAISDLVWHIIEKFLLIIKCIL